MTDVEHLRGIIPAPIRAEVDSWPDEGAREYLADFARLARIEARCRRLDWTFPIVGVLCVGWLIFVAATIGYGDWVAWSLIGLACIHAIILQSRIRQARERRADFLRYAIVASYVKVSRDIRS